MPNRTIMAFDYGTQNIGVAIGQEMLKQSNPLTTLKATDGIPNWEDIGKLVEEWQPQLFVVGLPLNSDISVRAKKFSRRLLGRFQIESTLVDERLSSFEAEQYIKKLPVKTRSSLSVDAVAAAFILESWFSQTTTNNN